MNSTELITLLQNNFSIEEFAYNDSPTMNTFSENALKAQEILNEWVKNNPNPGYSNKNYNQWLIDYDKYPSNYDISRQEWLKEKGIPNWIEVGQYGGEGQGDTWYSIKHFPALDIYLKVEGYYQSYNGTEFYDGWDCCSEVKPIQKTITVFE
jgi:hypothetical protein